MTFRVFAFHRFFRLDYEDDVSSVSHSSERMCVFTYGVYVEELCHWWKSGDMIIGMLNEERSLI